MTDRSKKSKRSYYFATVIYPDSTPDNWKDIIESWHVPCYVSPLHDQDKYGDEKKEAHRHVLLSFDSLKSVEQARELFEQINGKGCELINSKRSYARYLLHLDSPDKFQYSREDLIQISCNDYDDCISSLSDQVAAIRWVEQFINQEDIISFFELQKKLDQVRPEFADMFRISKVFYIQEYIKSRYWHVYKSADDMRPVDPVEVKNNYRRSEYE